MILLNDFSENHHLRVALFLGADRAGGVPDIELVKIQMIGAAIAIDVADPVGALGVFAGKEKRHEFAAHRPRFQVVDVTINRNQERAAKRLFVDGEIDRDFGQ